MIILATFVYYLSTALAAPVPVDQATTTPDPATTRTLRDIIVSCLTTIFACTWVSMHPNIPAPKLKEEEETFWETTKRGMQKFCRRDLVTFMIALLFPEYIVGWAIRQRLAAIDYVKTINQYTDCKKIKMVHAFFVIMGGVHKRTENGSYPLDRYQVASLLGVDIKRIFTEGSHFDEAKAEEKLERIGLSSEEELQDKSKSDWLAKLLVLAQILWFIIQSIARVVKRLPLTELEVITLAYAVLNFAIYIAWWDKPSRVNCPMLITADVKPERAKELIDFVESAFHYLVGYQDHYVQLNWQREVPNFYNGYSIGSHVRIASFISFLLSTAFGALHCIDWNFAFTSLTEQKLWRISSLLLTGVSFAAVVATFAFLMVTANNNYWEDLGMVVGIPILLISPLLVLGYLAARVSTIYIAFHSLHSLPPEAFVAVRWTSLIPHI